MLLTVALILLQLLLHDLVLLLSVELRLCDSLLLLLFLRYVIITSNVFLWLLWQGAI